MKNQLLNSVANFMKANLKLIRENRFTELYVKGEDYLTEEYQDPLNPYLTDALTNCGINPMEHMHTLPKNYLHDGQLKNLTIAKSIKTVRSNSLYCTSLKKLEIPLTIEHICLDNFSNNINLEITYPGTQKQFKDQVNVSYSVTKYPIQILCNDATITYDPIIKEAWDVWEQNDHYIGMVNKSYADSYIDVRKQLDEAIDQLKSHWDSKINVIKDSWDEWYRGNYEDTTR